MGYRAKYNIDFFQLSADLCCVGGLNWQLYEVNSAWSRLLGYSPSEIVGRSLLDFVHPEDLKKISTLKENNFSFNPIFEVEVRFFKKSGESIWTTWAGTFDNENNVFWAVGKDISRLKFKQATIDAEREKFQKLVEDFPMPAVVIISEQLIPNRKAQALTGYGPDEILNLNSWFEKLFGDRSSEVKKLYFTDRAEGFPRISRVPIKTKNGTSILIDFTGYYDKEYEIWVLNDVTDKVFAEEKFKKLFQSSHAAHVLYGENGFLDCNEATLRVLGFQSKAELLYRKPFEISPEFQPCGMKSSEKMKLNDAIAYEKGFHRFEWTLKRANGEEFPVEVILSVVEVQGQFMLLVVWHDLSEDRKQSRLISKITHSIPSLLYVYKLADRTGSFINQAVAEMLGYSAEEFISLSIEGIYPLIHPEDLSRVMKSRLRWNSLNEGEFEEIEYRIQAKDGRYIWLSDRAAVFSRDVKGEVSEIIGFAKDITAQKETLELLERERANSIQSSHMATLGMMAGGIAHEINNPLAIIIGRVHRLKDLAGRPDCDPKFILGDLEKIEQTAHRISKIVRGLRSFARDGQRDPFELGSVKQIIDDTIELCAPRFKYSAIELRVLALQDSQKIFCRPVQIAQVLLNLLNNAHDAILGCDEKIIEIEVKEIGAWTQILVRDSGPGIPNEIRHKLMQPFFTTKEVGKGTGLGLSISRSIIEEHKGRLYLAEEPRTCFVIELSNQAISQAG